jgi:hypothetical protein
MFLRAAVLAGFFLMPAALRAQDETIAATQAAQIPVTDLHASSGVTASPSNAAPDPVADQSRQAPESSPVAAPSEDAGNAAQPDGSITTPIGPGLGGLHTATLPPDAYGDNPTGVPYSDIFTPTGADFNNPEAFYASPIRTNFDTPGTLAGGETSLGFNAGNVIPSIPLIHPSSEPEDADLKVGPFYVKFRSLDGIAAYDDNFKQSQTNRQSETLVLLQLNLTVIAQLSDSLQFALSGAIGYLPLQNQFGLETDDYGVLGLLLASAPFFRAQTAYDTMIAGWPVTFGDDFRVGTGRYSTNTENNFDLFDGDYLEREQNGNYTFRPATTGLRDTTPDEKPLNQSFTYLENTVSALTQQQVPGDALLSMSISRDDLWYNQGGRGLPTSRDQFIASIVSQRQNLRFKPYAYYDASYSQGTGISGVAQSGAVGFFGPIDEQLFIQAEAGLYSVESNESYLYRLVLAHDAGPYTKEYLALTRNLASFDEEQATSEYYRLNQVLGPTLNGTIFLSHSSYKELAGGLSSRNEYLGGAQLSWVLGPKTTLDLAGIYERQQYAEGYKTDVATARATLDRIVTDTLTLQVLYEYQHAVANRSGNTYFENLVYLRIIKYL